MINDKEIEWISKELETGQVSAIAAHRTILALKNQQAHIFQLNTQLKSVQKIVSQLSFDLQSSRNKS